MTHKVFKLKLFADLFNDLCDSIEVINSTFTFQLVIVITSFLLIDIFTAYGILRELMKHQNGIKLALLSNFIWIFIQYLIKIFIAHAGSSTTSEAEKAVVIVTKALGSMEFDQELKVDLNFHLIQMRCRNKNLQNVFFVINWQFILTVSFFNVSKIDNNLLILTF
jgi:7tm Chemosensory receptor